MCFGALVRLVFTHINLFDVQNVFFGQEQCFLQINTGQCKRCNTLPFQHFQSKGLIWSSINHISTDLSRKILYNFLKCQCFPGSSVISFCISHLSPFPPLFALARKVPMSDRENYQDFFLLIKTHLSLSLQKVHLWIRYQFPSLEELSGEWTARDLVNTNSQLSHITFLRTTGCRCWPLKRALNPTAIVQVTRRLASSLRIILAIHYSWKRYKKLNNFLGLWKAFSTLWDKCTKNDSLRNWGDEADIFQKPIWSGRVVNSKISYCLF